jgi:hypothetical protein
MTRRWKAPDVADMQGERVQFAHVAKHLYAPHEHWDQVILDLGDPRRGAWEAGCPREELRADQPDCYRVCAECRAHLLRDHDEVLAPAYRDAIAEAETSRRFTQIDRSGWKFVNNQGVTVIVREVGLGRRPEVKTAYRVVPRRGDGTTPEEFFKAAVRKLRDKASRNGGGQ